MEDSPAEDSPADQPQPPTGAQLISQRTDQILIKLLDGMERDIADGKLPSPHLATYEALIAAEGKRGRYRSRLR